MTLTTPALLSRTLFGFRSAWQTPRRCMWTSPEATFSKTCTSRGMGMRGQVSSVLPLTYSMSRWTLRTRNSQSRGVSRA